jgi:hypothetical protein
VEVSLHLLDSACQPIVAWPDFNLWFMGFTDIAKDKMWLFQMPQKGHSSQKIYPEEKGCWGVYQEAQMAYCMSSVRLIEN